MENIKMQPGRFYITTDDGKKLEFDGVVEFKPDANESVPKLNKNLSDLSFSGAATFETPIKKFLEAVFYWGFGKKKGRRDKYQRLKQ
ncbi:Uncharacterised protein [Acetobacterium wieringae]|uniref:hypothetical protein n=1 Tax=Acetobacterium wieringae TaxID=52694 RepID=UPI001DF7A28F|nr:hypothetical protein [Acetobacterium wieringae]VUZ28523.1 Uncharacterised protein [Acetobacterium wieringae]